MRKPRISPRSERPSDLVLSTIDRLTREKAELLEEVRQLRAAVAIYQRIAEQVTGRIAEELKPTGTS
jgi:hypothetical protein